MTEKIPLTLEARAAFLAARPLLLLNPRSPTNIEIATELWALPILERLSDRMEAELRRLVDAGLPFEALPVVSRIAIWYATKDLMALAVEIEALGRKAYAVTRDVRDAGSVDGAVRDAVDRASAIDILVKEVGVH